MEPRHEATRTPEAAQYPVEFSPGLRHRGQLYDTDEPEPGGAMKLPVELLLALRYMLPRTVFVTLITLLSVLGVMLGVFALIVVLSVMEGFETELRDRLIGFNAHLNVSNGGVMNEHQLNEVLATLDTDPDVLAYTPYATGPVLAQFHGNISTPVIRGIPAEGTDAVVSLRDKIVYGEYDLSGNTILVGDQWARRNGALIGDEVLIYAPSHLEAMRQNYEAMNSGDPDAEQVALLPTNYVIVGIYSTGINDVDANFFLTSLFNMQRLYKLDDGAHGVHVRLRDPDPVAVFPVAQRLDAQLREPLRARSWMDQNRALFNAIATEKVTMSIILSIIVAVAGLCLANTLITVTVQKKREIAVLKALGAHDGQVIRIFAFYGSVVGVIGAATGIVLALLALEFRNNVVQFFSNNLGVDVLSKDVYPLPELPAVLHASTVVGVAIFALIVCILAALIPAYAAARVDPARSLHYE